MTAYIECQVSCCGPLDYRGPEARASRPGTDLGSAGPQAILVLVAPSRCDLFGRLFENRESMPRLCVVSPKKSIFCCTDIGFTCALDIQQKLKPFLHSSKEQMALRSFLGIYSYFV